MRSRGTQEYQKKIMISFFSLENTYSNGIKAYFNLAGINVWNFGQHSVEKSDQLCVRRRVIPPPFPPENHVIP